MHLDLAAIRAAVHRLPYGKRLPTAVYVLDDGEQSRSCWPAPLPAIVRELRERCSIGDEFNVLKFHTNNPKISFLAYPDFWLNPHPELVHAAIVNLVTGAVRVDSYTGRANRPILHRKDAFLPPDHPKRRLFAQLSQAEEAAGLLSDGSRIGFRLNWEKVLATSGYALRGHQLVAAASNDVAPHQESESPRRIERHRTALPRTELSKPVKLLLELGQLELGASFLDYGCGFGTDVAGLSALGHDARGWDPVHAPDGVRAPAKVVNLGFVLNVIEDPAERVEVLQSAWRLTERLLVVATLMESQEPTNSVDVLGDGIVTARRTFQKYYSPAELHSFIEDALDADTVPVAYGIHFVYRHAEDLQDFLARRSRRFVDWEVLSSRLGLRRILRQKADPYDRFRDLLDAFWNLAVELGRTPREDEFPRLAEVRAACGSVPRAMALFIERFGQATFDAARERRREDLLVFLAAARLRQRMPFTRLSVRLQRDVQNFFGSYAEAEERALEVLFAAGDPDELALAVQNLGFGWWDAAEQQFTVHRSLLDELPLILRVYVECAARLFGNPGEADLIKFHLRSRKLTFQHYDDFDGAAFPELRLRIKIDLPKLFVTVLDQRDAREQQILYFKERFVGTAYPHRARFERVGRRLRALGFDPATIGYGPSKKAFEQLLQARGLRSDLTARQRTKD